MDAGPRFADVRQLIADIRIEKLYKSHEIAQTTAALLEKIIAEDDWTTAAELMTQIKERIKIINEALPLEGIMTNILRHSLQIIRNEYIEELKDKNGAQIAPDSRMPFFSEELDYSELLTDLKPRLLDYLSEYKVELETSIHTISTQALEHIEYDEIILTVGKSETVERFLKHVAKDRSFEVVIAESAPLCRGHELAASLAKSNIKATVISDASVFSIMSRVTKVIVGTQLVLADGGLRAPCGMHAIALSAKRFSVPVLVLAHVYKLTPVYVGSYELDVFCSAGSPVDVLPFTMGSILNKAKVLNPLYDYVQPELITLLVSHQGGIAPTAVSRLLTDLYNPSDYDI